jgi:hypothetical protein
MGTVLVGGKALANYVYIPSDARPQGFLERCWKLASDELGEFVRKVRVRK